MVLPLCGYGIWENFYDYTDSIYLCFSDDPALHFFRNRKIFKFGEKSVYTGIFVCYEKFWVDAVGDYSKCLCFCIRDFCLCTASDLFDRCTGNAEWLDSESDI